MRQSELPHFLCREMLGDIQKKAFSEDLLTWFESEKEEHPWRQTTDPWAILVSEVMLQQTQVATVLGRGFYTSFLQKFPDVESISKASEQEILAAWEGLGYYRRVRNLQKTANAVLEQHGGTFPQSHEELLTLPGVGPYTAGAVASFAYGLAHELVDANVSRVFSRLFDYQVEVDSSVGLKQMWKWAKELLDRENPALYNSALMELGQKVCKNKNPQCMLCPVRSHCATDEPDALPKKKLKRKSVEVEEQCALVTKEGSILLQKQGASERREGMWSLPVLKIAKRKNAVYTAKYTITHHKVALSVYKAEKYDPKKSDQWFAMEELVNIPMPSPFRKAVTAILEMEK